MEATKIPCIDLKERFSRRYRVTHEESYLAEYGPGARVADPWLTIILCRYGHVFPFGGDTLAASVDGFPKVAGRLRRPACLQVVQDGDFGELTITFNVVDFSKVAKIMRHRRRITPEQRERLREMGFQKGAQAHAHVQYTARKRHPEGLPDSEKTCPARCAYSSAEEHTEKRRRLP